MGTEAFKAELDHEVDYIFDNLSNSIQNHERVYHNDSNIKARIRQILIFLRSKDYLYDVPMIAKYRKFDYQGGQILQEHHVQMIANLDVEYGKFRGQMQQIIDFLTKLLRVLDSNSEGDLEIQNERQLIVAHLRNLEKCKSFGELQEYQPLVQFYKQFYKIELEQA